MKLHFVGIGGIGMSGIAEVFLNQGYAVSGSDLQSNDTTARLAGLGAKIELGHRAENVAGAQVVVISSAVGSNNPEVLEARRLRIPVIPRAEMLGELMRRKTGIAVGGTHGKTTTTSMIAFVLNHAGLDPTIVVGGRVDSFGGNARLGKSELVVAEADESDGSFLHLPSTYAVVTNIDNDHLDHFGTMAALEEAFVGFVGKLPFYGVAAVCGEDAGVRRVIPRLTKPIVTYGFSSTWDYSAHDVRAHGFGSTFTLNKGKERLGEMTLGIPGAHNVLNALAAVIISERLGVPFAKLEEGLRGFLGVKRRFDVRWQDKARRRLVVDDYGHHPTEIVATLQAARTIWPGRIVTVFQPHRFSRTLHCREGFSSAFAGSDVLLVTDIYAAGEDPIEGVNAETLAADITQAMGDRLKVRCVGDLEGAKSAVLEIIRDGDLVLCLGAGSITRLPERLVAELRAELET